MNSNDLIVEKSPLTMGDILAIAEETGLRVVDVILEEAVIMTGLKREQVLLDVMQELEHNLEAIEIGLKDGYSPIMGTVGNDLTANGMVELFKDDFINQALIYTLAAQVGNHVIGLNPCAGTGDSCPYTGFIRAMQKTGYDEVTIAETAALMLKIGSYFRVGKTTTGCNMEGFGAGATAVAAAVVSLRNGSPKAMEKAMVLAISPTVAVPCTPRVMVPGLCATHIGGAIVVGNLSAGLALNTNIEVNVPIDVMLVMAAEVHPVSAREIVPVVGEYMKPFFKTKQEVENLITEETKVVERVEMEQTLLKAKAKAKQIAAGASPITNTLGEAVVGGSSQAVGSPTNAARIAHYLAEGKGKIKRLTVELYPELFARRGINMPGIIMGSVFGAPTSDYVMYKESIDRMNAMGIGVDVIKGQDYGIQKITIETEQSTVMVDTLNRGGGRIVLRDALPSREEAMEIAKKLGIVVVEK
jgi:L-serine dehydratase